MADVGEKMHRAIGPARVELGQPVRAAIAPGAVGFGESGHEEWHGRRSGQGIPLLLGRAILRHVVPPLLLVAEVLREPNGIRQADKALRRLGSRAAVQSPPRWCLGGVKARALSHIPAVTEAG